MIIPSLKDALLDMKEENLIVQYYMEVYGDEMRSNCEIFESTNLQVIAKYYRTTIRVMDYDTFNVR